MIISFRCKSTREASLSFLEVPVAQRVGRIPANADQDHIDRKAHPFEVEHINSSRVRAPKFTRLASRLSLMRQNRRSTWVTGLAGRDCCRDRIFPVPSAACPGPAKCSFLRLQSGNERKQAT